MSIASIASVIVASCLYSHFALAIVSLSNAFKSRGVIGLPSLVSMAVFLVLLIGGSFLQNAIIKQVQKLNPEKKGNVLDSKFHREWFDSCDEAEKAQIGHAAYKSYRATSNAIVGAVLIAVFVSMMTPVGPLPAVLVCGIWAVQFSAYTKAAKEWKNKK